MKIFAALDVGDKATHICVLDGNYSAPCNNPQMRALCLSGTSHQRYRRLAASRLVSSAYGWARHPYGTR